MKKLLIVFVLSILFSTQMFSQQQFQNNFYTQNVFSINPAATGIQGNFTGYLNFRDQWSGLKGAPEVLSLGLHSLVSPAMGIGLNVEQNKVGVFKQFISELNYSYRLLLSPDQSLAFGLKAGFSQSSLNYQVMEVEKQGDATLYSSSPIVNETQIRFGTGVHYNRKKLNLHVSSPVLYGQQEKKYFQTVYGLAAYDFFADQNLWRFQPSVLFRHIYGSKGQADINLLAEYDKKFWGQLSYRTNTSFITTFGLYFNGFGLGYSYEINRNELSSIASGSHELLLHFETGFSFSKNKPHYKSSKRQLTR